MKKLILLMIFLFTNFFAEGRKIQKCLPPEPLIGQTCKDDQEAINKCEDNTPYNAYHQRSCSKCINNIPHCLYTYSSLLQ